MERPALAGGLLLDPLYLSFYRSSTDRGASG